MLRPLCQFNLAALLYAAAFLPLAAPAATPRGGDRQPLALAVVKPVMECAAMSTADVARDVGASTVVAAAAVVDDGAVAAYCRLEVTIDDYAKITMRMPVAAWTQRLLFGGGPGAQVAQGSTRTDQFVSVSWQDLGRRGREDDFANNYQLRVNAAYRGMHLQVLAAKALIAKYYGQAPRFSYYNACSEPGRQGMMAIQRYPEHFDGVAAGCPPLNFTLNNGLHHAWKILTNTGADGKLIITADKLPLLQQTVLAQCDAADGVKDDIVSDYFGCRPDLTAAQCQTGQDASTCLSPAQVRVAQELYRGAHDGQGGKLMPIGVLPGSENAWNNTIATDRSNNPTQTRNMTTTALRSQFSDPALSRSWEVGAVKFDRATFDATTKLSYLFDAINPDLSGFAKAGHKLILWQGMGDTNVLPAHAVLYFTALQQHMGAKSVERFARFYALPGVNHCGGGSGPSIADFLAPLMLWVERGVAPEALPGAHVPRTARGVGAGPGAQANAATPAAPTLTRPIYPYPYTAKYRGKGDWRDAANYVQGPARPAPASLSQWFGAHLYAPRKLQWCSGNETGLQCKDTP